MPQFKLHESSVIFPSHNKSTLLHIKTEFQFSKFLSKDVHPITISKSQYALDWHETFAHEMTVDVNSRQLCKTFYCKLKETCFGHLLELPHWGQSNKYSKHALWVNKNKTRPVCSFKILSNGKFILLAIYLGTNVVSSMTAYTTVVVVTVSKQSPRKYLLKKKWLGLYISLNSEENQGTEFSVWNSKGSPAIICP